MQEELFSYSPEEIDAMRQSLAEDVIKLRDLEEEKADTVKGYTNAIKILKIQINAKAGAIKGHRPASDNVASMVS